MNVGAERSKTPWLLVLNADVMLPHAAPTQMLARADALGADVVGFRQVDELGRLQLSAASADSSPNLRADLFSAALMAARAFGANVSTIGCLPHATFLGYQVRPC